MKKRNLVLFGSAAMLSLALAGSIGAVTAFADQTLSPGGSTSGEVQITYHQDNTWTVTIPDSMVIGTAAKVSASDVSIKNGTTLKVTVSSDNYSGGWKLKSDNGSGDKSIDYTLKAATTEGELESASPLEDNGTVLEVKVGETEGNASIIGEVSGTPATGEDTYSDTLTFSVEVEDDAG